MSVLSSLSVVPPFLHAYRRNGNDWEDDPVVGRARDRNESGVAKGKIIESLIEQRQTTSKRVCMYIEKKRENNGVLVFTHPE